MQPFTIYFPQFYPTPTNDRTWGKGFTDWILLGEHNIRVADMRRRAPARGLYDGSDPAVHRAQQAEMKAHGIGGIGLYHYWFYTHQELGAFEAGLRSGTTYSGLPWFLIWANEDWTRRWLGNPGKIVTLDPEPEDAAIAAHCRHLATCFEAVGYFRQGGRPVFAWYNLRHFARPRNVLEQYRKILLTMGHDVMMVNFVKNVADLDECADTDGTYVFEPRMFFGWGRADRGKGAAAVFRSTRSLLGRDVADRLVVMAEKISGGGGISFAADDFVQYMGSAERRDLLASIEHGYQDVISPGWDNRPRYGDQRFTALEPLSGGQFAELVKSALDRGGLPPLVNAWNEWTELAAIEPCAYQQSRYLDAISAFDLHRPAS